MYKDLIEQDLKRVVVELGFPASDIVLSIPENPQFGDYSSNIPLQLAKQNLKKPYQSSLEIANEILEKLKHPAYLERVEIAGPGFLNFFLKDESLVKSLARETGKKEPTGRNILIEFAHPNTHKAFHIGHLRNITIGESISRLLDFEGNNIFRVTYGGDIGPHVAKALWGILKLKDEFEAIRLKSLRERAEFLGKAYALGSQTYEEDEKAKKEIEEINQKLYQGSDKDLKELWEKTKHWSIGYFETIYSRVGTEFDAQIWESEIQELGSLIVEENLSRVFEKDEGAVIFRGEKYGLHNRVFITSKGYPTYEGKELGLTRKEQELFPYDLSLHVVANEQESFFEVTTKALELINMDFKGKKKHMSYGMVNLSTGKMSSRKGEVITAEFLIDQVKKEIAESYGNLRLSDKELDKVAIGAIKFYFLKYSLSSNIAFDIKQSISLQGDSGPYLQYTYARINSLVNRPRSLAGPAERFSYENRATKNEGEGKQNHAQQAEIAHPFDTVYPERSRGAQGKKGLEEEERQVLRQLEYFEGVIEKAATEYKPNELSIYLLNLARAFNLFYERYPILKSDKEFFRLELTRKTGEIIKRGLYLLGIETLERM